MQVRSIKGVCEIDRCKPLTDIALDGLHPRKVSRWHVPEVR
jgi:hypothetical protein